MRARPGEAERSLVFFTVLTQTAVGVCVVGAFSPGAPGLSSAGALALLVAGGLAAAVHLGRIGHARFALSNLRFSWLSREAALGSLFGAALIAALALPRVPALGIAAAVIGLALVGAISGIYMIRTVPPWNTWMTPAAFYLTTVVLGSAVAAAALGLKLRQAGLVDVAGAAIGLQVVAGAAIGLQVVVAIVHFLRFGRPELRSTLAARIALAIGGAAVMLTGPDWATTSACVLLIASEVLGRHLFYASHRRVGL